MKNWNKLFITLFIIFSLLGTFKLFEFLISYNFENHKNVIIKSYSIKLKSCFDLDNKNKRSIQESLNLIEYCVKEFGSY